MCNMVAEKQKVLSFEAVNSSRLDGVRPVRQEFVPELHWKGSVLSLFLLQQAFEFLHRVYDRHKAEAVLRLFYHEEQDIWGIDVFKQTVSATRCDDDCDPKAMGDWISAGWQQFGTIHSHGSMSAFQSGTDHKDETRNAGLHITVGHLDREVLSFHARFTFHGLHYETDIVDWVRFDHESCVTGDSEVAQHLRRVESELLMSRRSSDIVERQMEDWLSRVSPRPVATVPHRGFGAVSFGNRIRDEFFGHDPDVITAADSYPESGFEKLEDDEGAGSSRADDPEGCDHLPLGDDGAGELFVKRYYVNAAEKAVEELIGAAEDLVSLLKSGDLVRLQTTFHRLPIGDDGSGELFVERYDARAAEEAVEELDDVASDLIAAVEERTDAVWELISFFKDGELTRLQAEFDRLIDAC